MQPLLRKAATASIRPQARRALRTATAEVRTPRSTALHAAIRTPWVCRTCSQARPFSSASNTASLSSSLPRSESEGKVKIAKKSEPLRILFCGSDHFSCAALEALNRERENDPGLIESIDVVVRPGKRAGRGNRDVVYPPIRDLATSLGLPIHERDTFTGWDMPPQTNIIIAVSFGLFVPPRLLQQARFGGLNIHPSLLPDLRGPAPLHHALLSKRESTGVTLQTLDPERFDHGKILAQTPDLPIPPKCDYQTLLDLITPTAAALLIRGLKDGVYIPPLEEVQTAPKTIKPNPLQHAPKITKADRQILEPHLPDLPHRFRVLGPLWLWSRDRSGARKRIIFEQISAVDASSFVPCLSGSLCSLPLEEDISPSPSPSPNSLSQVTDPNTKGTSEAETKTTHLAIWVPKNKEVDDAVYVGSHRVEMAKVEGAEAKPAVRALKNFLVRVEGRGEVGWEDAKGLFVLE
ncbi:Formyltransferase [Annulohypoxylon maeteangense]|uniref:Formyltransferase n=1 Tax=Annulohypoxylon maeteangense TaxID=1927788 RepID=UPI002008BF46|nr:Formyltransferase [Annulohypoxylon maeteangense]KAI0881761.1 Formyltransferase [Annulohypoxylon maeteangense]